MPSHLSAGGGIGSPGAMTTTRSLGKPWSSSSSTQSLRSSSRSQLFNACTPFGVFVLTSRPPGKLRLLYSNWSLKSFPLFPGPMINNAGDGFTSNWQSLLTMFLAVDRALNGNLRASFKALTCISSCPCPSSAGSELTTACDWFAIPPENWGSCCSIIGRGCPYYFSVGLDRAVLEF